MSTLESAFRVHHLVCYEASEKNTPFIYSQALLSYFSLDVSALFSIFSLNQSFARCASFLFFQNGIECTAVIYISVIL